jgi:hypothetical protein
MWCTVTFHGVPIGTVELEEYELTSGIMEPLAAYQAVRPTVRRGSAALLSVGFYGTAALTAGEGEPAAIEALSEAAAMRFELLDERGEQLEADFVNLIEPPDEETVVVIARFRGAAAGVPARRPSRRASGREGEAEHDSG